MISSCTVELAHSSTPPMGAKRTPTAKKSGSTVLGVKMGCQAFSRCWRKALSVLLHQPKHVQCSAVQRISLGGLLLFACSFLSTSSLPRVLFASFCCCTSIVCDIDMPAIVAYGVVGSCKDRDKRDAASCRVQFGRHDDLRSTNSSLPPSLSPLK